MLYTLEDLLRKMGAPEVEEKGEKLWHCLNGFAEIKLIENGHRLIAEQQQTLEQYEDDNGRVHPRFAQNFYLHAERCGSQYRVTKVAFDGEAFQHPESSMVELAMSMFHARAVTISVLMLEESLNKQDILEQKLSSDFGMASATPERKQRWGVVVPFPAAKAPTRETAAT